MTTINVALVGFGNIGTGVVRLFQENGNLINDRAGLSIVMHTICDPELKRDRGISTDGIRMTTDYKSIVSDPDIHVVIELVGGTTIAKDIIMASLSAGKHVVTANKAVIATHGGELFKTARDNNASLLFESAVGAGVPFIRAMQGGLLPNNFKGVYGILNGTCNYILTEMENDPSKSFDDVLKVAMDLGYAEPDPTLDIEGDDAAHKISIMGSLAFGFEFNGKDVIKDGITKITPVDFEFARKHGQTIRLIASATLSDSGDISLSTAPTLLPDDHLIAGIKGVTNTCLVDCDQAGPMQFSGAGAGQGSTASGVIGDICHIAMAGDKLSQMNPLTITTGNRTDKLNATPYPKRVLRLTGDSAKDAASKLGLKIIEEINDSIFAFAPEQKDQDRQSMMAELEKSGITGNKVCDLRFAFQTEGILAS